MRPALVWATAVAGTLAWVALGAVFDRYTPHTRYSGMGVFVILYYGLAAAASLLFALVHQLWRRARPIFGVLAVAAGAVPIVMLGVTVVEGEARLAEERGEEARVTGERVRGSAASPRAAPAGGALVAGPGRVP